MKYLTFPGTYPECVVVSEENYRAIRKILDLPIHKDNAKIGYRSSSLQRT